MNFAICNLQFAIDVNAAFKDDLYSARINSMAGAFVAVADDSQSVFIQPAGLANLKNPEFSLSYGHVYWGLDDGSQITSPVLSLGMPLSKKLSFGLGYKTISLQNVYDESTITSALAYKLNGFSSVGLAYKNLSIKYGSDSYTLIDPVLKSKNTVSDYDLDIGLFIQPLPFLSFGYSKQGLLGANIGLDEKIKSPAVERIGAAYKENMFKVIYENVKQDNTMKNLMGIEKVFLNNSFALRFGFGWGDNEFGKLAVGAGANFNQFSLDYSFDYPLKGIENTSGVHFLSFNVRFLKPEENAAQPRKEKKQTGEEIKKAFKDKLQGMLSQKQVKEPLAQQTKKACFWSPMACISSLGELIKPPELYTSPFYIAGPLGPFQFQVEEPGKELGIVEQNNIKLELEKLAPPATGQIDNTIETLPAQKENAVSEVPSAPGAPAIAVEPQPEKIGKPKAINKEKDKVSVFKSHTVLSGETLPMIAKKYYGKESDWIKIYEANKDHIEKGSLKQGQVLVIPQ